MSGRAGWEGGTRGGDESPLPFRKCACFLRMVGYVQTRFAVVRRSWYKVSASVLSGTGPEKPLEEGVSLKEGIVLFGKGFRRENVEEASLSVMPSSNIGWFLVGLNPLV